MADLIVTTAGDTSDSADGVLSLREAIAAAARSAAADRITFDAPSLAAGGGTILLDDGALTITQAGGALTIDGDLDNDGLADVTLDADRRGRVLVITGNDAAAPAKVELNGLVMTGGVVPDTAYGAGLQIRDATVKIVNSTITDNEVGHYRIGGGIFTADSDLLIENSLIADNSALSGGAIYATDSELRIVRSVLSDNVARGNVGGGGAILGVDSRIELEASTLHRNEAAYGGALRVQGGALLLAHTTVSGNSAYEGGGISAANAAVFVTASTITANVARGPSTTLGLDAAGGGGISSNVNIVLTGSLVAGNQALQGARDIEGSILSDGTNLFSQASLGGAQTSDLVVGAGTGTVRGQLLRPLGDNGGPTPTHLLRPGSAAIDTGSTGPAMDPATGRSLVLDQRGRDRLIGSAVDIGAVEFDPAQDALGDEDGDGLRDNVDPFAKDAANGLGRAVGFGLEFNGTDPATGLFGFTGVMTDGLLPYLELVDQPLDPTLPGGPSTSTSISGGFLRIDNVPGGDAFREQNHQRNAFQFGIDPQGQAITVETAFLNPFKNGALNFQSLGLQVGTGGQDQYLKLVFGRNFASQFQLLAEDQQGPSRQSDLPPGLTLADVDYVKLFLDLAPGSEVGPGRVSGRYVIYEGLPGSLVELARGTIGTLPLPDSVAAAVAGVHETDGTPSGLAIGVIATSTTGAGDEVDQPFDAAWDYLRTYVSEPGRALLTVNADGTGIDASTYFSSTLRLANQSQNGLAIKRVVIDLSTANFPDIVFDPADGSPAGDSTSKGFTVDREGGTGVVLPADRNGPPTFLGPYENGYRRLAIDFASGAFQPGESLGFSLDIDPTSIAGQVGSGPAGSISGLELTGTTVTVLFENGTSQRGQIFADGSLAGGEAHVRQGLAEALSLRLGSLDNGEVGWRYGLDQTLLISGGPAGAAVRVALIEGVVASVAPTPPVQLTDPEFDANRAADVTYFEVVLDADGSASVALGSALAIGSDSRWSVEAVVVDELDAGSPGLEAAGAVGPDITFKLRSLVDEDGDDLDDRLDPFATDAINGKGRAADFALEFDGGDPTTSLFGFTGIMSDGVRKFAEQFDLPLDPTAPAGPASSTAIANGFLRITNVTGGDAYAEQNDQDNAFQLGVDPLGAAFTLTTGFRDPFAAAPSSYQSLGLFIGTGDDDDYVKLVFGQNQGRHIQLLAEADGLDVGQQAARLPTGVTFAAITYVELAIDVLPDGGGGPATATGRYTLYSGPADARAVLVEAELGALILPDTVAAAFQGTHEIDGVASGLAVGLISTSTTGFADGIDQPFDAQFDYLRATTDPLIA